jgi:hypothetical protein
MPPAPSTQPQPASLSSPMEHSTDDVGSVGHRLPLVETNLGWLIVLSSTCYAPETWLPVLLSNEGASEGLRQVNIGKSPQAAVFLPDRTLGNQHAEITLDPFGRFYVRDLGSPSGVYLGTGHGPDTPVTGSEPTRLRSGAHLRIGENHIFLFRALFEAGDL